MDLEQRLSSAGLTSSLVGADVRYDAAQVAFSVARPPHTATEGRR